VAVRGLRLNLAVGEAAQIRRGTSLLAAGIRWADNWHLWQFPEHVSAPIITSHPYMWRHSSTQSRSLALRDVLLAVRHAGPRRTAMRYTTASTKPDYKPDYTTVAVCRKLHVQTLASLSGRKRVCRRHNGDYY
jgi:hypothetical protein